MSLAIFMSERQIYGENAKYKVMEL